MKHTFTIQQINRIDDRWWGVFGQNVQRDPVIKSNGELHNGFWVPDNYRFSSRRHIIQVIKKHYPNARIITQK